MKLIWCQKQTPINKSMAKSQGLQKALGDKHVDNNKLETKMTNDIIQKSWVWYLGEMKITTEKELENGFTVALWWSGEEISEKAVKRLQSNSVPVFMLWQL